MNEIPAYFNVTSKKSEPQCSNEHDLKLKIQELQDKIKEYEKLVNSPYYIVLYETYMTHKQNRELFKSGDGFRVYEYKTFYYVKMAEFYEYVRNKFYENKISPLFKVLEYPNPTKEFTDYDEYFRYNCIDHYLKYGIKQKPLILDFDNITLCMASLGNLETLFKGLELEYMTNRIQIMTIQFPMIIKQIDEMLKTPDRLV